MVPRSRKDDQIQQRPPRPARARRERPLGTERPQHHRRNRHQQSPRPASRGQRPNSSVEIRRSSPMNTKKTWVLALVSLIAAYGCVTNSDDDKEDNGGAEQSQDELNLRRGSVDHAAIVESTTMMLAGGPTSPLLDPYNQE